MSETRDMDRIALLRRVLDLEARIKEEPQLRAEYNEALEAAEDRLGWDAMMDFYLRVSISRRMWWPDAVAETRH